MTPFIHDLNHANKLNIPLAAKSGLVGVIHKASQGVMFDDDHYAPRRKMAKQCGLLWGAYHFNTGQSPSLQVNNFFRCADPDESTVMVLDYENNDISPMTFRQMIDFLCLADEKLGRPVDIYSGNLIKENIHAARPADIALLKKRRLWLCQYGPVAKMVDANHRPLPWDHWWLWQYTGDGVGPLPHTLPGLEPGADLSTFNGTAEQLRATWVPLTS